MTGRDVFDGRGLAKDNRESEARRRGCRIILISGVCKKGGHRFQTRKGHCPQCDTLKLRFQDRDKKTAVLYVAYSKTQKLTKVGLSIDVSTREAKINFEGYAGASDWETIFRVRVRNAGKLEALAHGCLRTARVRLTYMKDRTRNQTARESFKCSPLDAVNAVVEILSAHGGLLEKTRCDGSLVRKLTEHYLKN